MKTGVLLLLTSFILVSLNDNEKYLDYYAGEDFPSGAISHFSLPNRYIPDSSKSPSSYSGRFIGKSSYNGDRRFDPFDVAYRIDIDIKNRSEVFIIWDCKFHKKGSSSWISENPEMKVKNAKYGRDLVWGDMFFLGDDGVSYVTRPFLALFVIDSGNNNKRGILLIDRSEGVVFLDRQKITGVP